MGKVLGIPFTTAFRKGIQKDGRIADLKTLSAWGLPKTFPELMARNTSGTHLCTALGVELESN